MTKSLARGPFRTIPPPFARDGKNSSGVSNGASTSPSLRCNAVALHLLLPFCQSTSPFLPWRWRLNIGKHDVRRRRRRLPPLPSRSLSKSKLSRFTFTGIADVDPLVGAWRRGSGAVM